MKKIFEQLTLPLIDGGDSFRDFLEKATFEKISLTITDNSTSLLSVRTKNNVVCVRLQRIFLEADGDIREEIADFIRNKKGRTPHLRNFAKQNLDSIKKNFTGRITIKTQGRHHDLCNMYQSVNKKYFNDRIACPITWGIKRAGGYIRKRTLGSYSRHTNTIRISPLLDKKTVPVFYLKFIVYHEMLHADMGVQEDNGRRSYHSREFRNREKLFEDYEKAIEWEKKYI